MAWLSPVWLDVPPDSYGTVRLAAGILVLDAVLFSLLYLPQSVLQGENLGYKRLGLSVLLVFVSKSLLVVAVYFGAGIGGLAVATAVATVLWGRPICSSSGAASRGSASRDRASRRSVISSV